MDHIVYMDFKSKELENILLGKKDIILRGATGRKLPYGRAKVGDTLYLCNNNGEMKLQATCNIKAITFTDKLSKEDSIALVESIENRVKLNVKALSRFKGKRYLSIIEIDLVKEIDQLSFKKDAFSNMDDWLLVEDINNVL